MENYEKEFEKMKPILVKAMKHIRIKGWETDDYFQEGRIIFYKLVVENHSESQLRIRFKVLFRQRLIDTHRFNRAQKRQFNEMHYQDIYDHADYIAQNHKLEEKVMLKLAEEEIIQLLTDTEKEILHQIIQGKKIPKPKKRSLAKKLEEAGFKELLLNLR